MLAVIDRNSDYERFSQRYLLGATWYARPGLTLNLQYNYRLKTADYNHLIDNTANAAPSTNRYPAFIIDQDIEFNAIPLNRDRLRVAFARLSFDALGLVAGNPNYTPAEPRWRLGLTAEASFL